MSQYLVTGANRGIGLEFAQQLLARGDRVIATARHPGRATALNRMAAQYPGHLRVLPLDVAEARSIAELERELGMLELQIDVLIHNAGMLTPGEHFGQVEAAAFAQTFATNSAGPFLLTQALAARLADSGKVVAISSGLGSIARTTHIDTISYAMSKAALNMGMRLLGLALAERRIAVLALSPGWVRTDMGGEDAELSPAESVAAMLCVIDNLVFDVEGNGGFRSRDGAPLAW